MICRYRRNYGANLYYNSGNVGIGTTTTSDVDDNTGFAMPTAPLFVKGGASVGGTCDVVFRGGVAGSEQGKARLWLSADASHSSYIQSQHTGSGNTQLTFGTSSGNALPTERMRISEAGNVGIGIASPVYKLHIKCNYSDVAGSLHLDADDGSNNPHKYALTIYPYIIVTGGEVGWRFRTLNYAGGANNTPLTLSSGGNVVVQNNLTAGSVSTSGININYISTTGTSGPLVIDPNYTTNNYIIMWDDVRIQGNFSVSSGTKSWRIKHPILENKDLIHICIEAPRADNLYRGRKQLFNGECEVNIDLECNTTGGMTDGTFVLINKNIQVFVNNNETFDRVIGKVVGNKLNIKCENENVDCYIDWLVIGERNDDDMKRCNSASGGSIIIEVERGEQPIRPPRTTCNSSNIDIEPSEPEGV